MSLAKLPGGFSKIQPPVAGTVGRYTVVVVREATIIGQEAWNPDLQ